MAATTETKYIRVDENSVAWIEGTATKVIEVVLDKIAYGWSPEAIQIQHPHLSLAQIHAAFSYYYDHQAELDADIERRLRWVEEMEAQATNQLTRRELEERLQREDSVPQEPAPEVAKSL